MPIFLVYRSTANDRNKLPFELGGVIMTAADATAAKAAANTRLSKITGVNNGALAASTWTALQLSNSDDLLTDVGPILITGGVVLNGERLQGGTLNL